MKRVCEMVEAGKVKPVIDSVWKFEDVKMVRPRYSPFSRTAFLARLLFESQPRLTSD